MLDIAGFCGLTYDPSRVDLSEVITPPYDVISEAHRERLARRSRFNFVSLDLPRAAGGADPYIAAAELLSSYRKEGIIRQALTPSLYRYHQTFVSAEDGIELTRKGFLAAARVSPWSTGTIRPHEATFAGAREDRMRLLEATQVHLSAVFAAYTDPDGDVDRLLAANERNPDLSARTEDGTLHRVWRVDDPGIIAEVAKRVATSRAYVLDGHHRYETMVAYHARAGARGAGPTGERGLMFFVPATDPGLIILPTHRLLYGLEGWTREDALRRLRACCQVEHVRDGARDTAAVRALLGASHERPSFVLVFPGSQDAHVLSLSPAGEPELASLHRVLLEGALGLPPAGRSSTHIKYVSDTRAALAHVEAAEVQAAVFVRAPTLAQIQQISDRGEVMPQKSTYFFPKLASGLVMMPLA